MTQNKKRVLVAMSGGVDSSVTAALLKNQGFDVVGVHMQLWDQSKSTQGRLSGRCCSLVDSNDARRVCEQIDVPYYVINAQDVFQEKVVDYFVHEYLQQRTPNPCAQCNTQIKFSYLFKKADELDCYWVATGHYAQVNQDSATGIASMNRGVDPQKDQTYFLFGLTQKALQRTLMPLGGFNKNMVRKLADEFKLNTAQKADSQEICFINDEGYKAFIEQRVPDSLRPRGLIKTLEGDVVGEHLGLHRYTIGQRKDLMIKVKNPELFFVVGFDKQQSTLYVGPESALYHKELVTTHMNWVRPVDDKIKSLRCEVKIRSQGAQAPCKVIQFDNNIVHIEFDEPQRAITAGQAAVLYKGEELLGGGFIDRIGSVQP